MTNLAIRNSSKRNQETKEVRTCPSCPWLLLPNPKTSPSDESMRVWWSPADNWTILTRRGRIIFAGGREAWKSDDKSFKIIFSCFSNIFRLFTKSSWKFRKFQNQIQTERHILKLNDLIWKWKKTQSLFCFGRFHVILESLLWNLEHFRAKFFYVAGLWLEINYQFSAHVFFDVWGNCCSCCWICSCRRCHCRCHKIVSAAIPTFVQCFHVLKENETYFQKDNWDIWYKFIIVQLMSD